MTNSNEYLKKSLDAVADATNNIDFISESIKATLPDCEEKILSNTDDGVTIKMAIDEYIEELTKNTRHLLWNIEQLLNDAAGISVMTEIDEDIFTIQSITQVMDIELKEFD